MASKTTNRNSKLEHKRELARERQRRHRKNVAKGVHVRPAVTYDLRKAPLATSSQLISTAGQSSVVAALNDFEFRKVDGNFYEKLREGIPIFDGGIRQLITLEGFLRPIGENMAIVKDLEDFFLNVPVNDKQTGIQAFQECTSNEKFEQGCAVTEFLANKKRDDIDRLIVADSKNIFFRRDPATGRADFWFRSGAPKQSSYTMPGSVIEQILTAKYGTSVTYNGVTETRLVPDNKNYFSIGNENQGPYGVSIMRSTEFVSQILVSIQNGFKHIAERFGDPSFHVHYKAGKGGGDIKTRRQELEDDFNAIVTAKRKGKSGDIVTAGGPDSDVTIKIIGHDGQIYSFDVPLRHLLEQIVCRFGISSWLLGIYWSTTERMATLEIEAALSAAKIRQLAMLPEYIKLCANFLRLRGHSWNTITTSLDKKGDWGLIFESPSYRDVMAMANARFLNAQASLMERGQSGPATTTSVQVGSATFELQGQKRSATENTVVTEKGKCTCGCGHGHSSHLAHSSYMSDKSFPRIGWNGLSVSEKLSLLRSWRAFGLSGTKEATRPIAWPTLDKLETEYETRLKSDWANLKGKVFDILGLKVPEVSLLSATSASSADKDSKAFEFEDDQRAQILKELRSYLGTYNSDDLDSPVRWYYAQSYSAGLIQAANLLGKDRPLLDILQNQNIYADLVTNGFQLVKDNATTTIKNEILDQMENLMLQGATPRDVASKLNSIFDAQNSDWERLARTEMSGAAENAKLDEWRERGVDVSGVYNRSVGAIVPVHPRCRCSTNVEDDGNGNFRAVFAPAPDACSWCLSLAEGD